MTRFVLSRIDRGTPVNFDCGNKDLNKFFKEERLDREDGLFLVTYALKLKQTGEIFAMVSVANDSIKAAQIIGYREVPKEERDRQKEKRPAVKIIGLGVKKDLQSRAIGTKLISFMQALFVINNKTGCRYMTVDALNNPDCIRFYQKKVDFKFCVNPQGIKGALSMYFDLLGMLQALNQEPTLKTYRAKIKRLIKNGQVNLAL